MHFAGMFTLVLTNPIWVAKTRLCLQYDVHPSQNVQFYTGMLDCFYKTYKFEGLKGLYKASNSDELLTVAKSRQWLMHCIEQCHVGNSDVYFQAVLCTGTGYWLRWSDSFFIWKQHVVYNVHQLKVLWL